MILNFCENLKKGLPTHSIGSKELRIVEPWLTVIGIMEGYRAEEIKGKHVDVWPLMTSTTSGTTNVSLLRLSSKLFHSPQNSWMRKYSSQ
jgi:hypothetical protein